MASVEQSLGFAAWERNSGGERVGLYRSVKRDINEITKGTSNDEQDYPAIGRKGRCLSVIIQGANERFANRRSEVIPLWLKKKKKR